MNEKFYAEGNVDKIVREKFFPDYSYKGVFVEVGGVTPEFLSMSRHFKLNEWRTIIVEPNPNFCEQQKKLENEVCQYACSNKNEDNVDFIIVGEDKSNTDQITEHSFSSLAIKDSYKKIGESYLESLPKRTIKVQVRTLDFIIDEKNINKIDILSVDTEGWELEVIKGLTKLKPSIIILENIWQDGDYRNYMLEYGYKLVNYVEPNDIYTKII